MLSRDLLPGQYLEHGPKSSQIPNRWNGMENGKYDLMHNLLGMQEEDFEDAQMRNGHMIFHYCHSLNFEANGEHDRWMPIKPDLCFEYVKSHFDRFPWIFDFNNRLFPKQKLLAWPYNFMQSVIHSESETLPVCNPIWALMQKFWQTSSVTSKIR
jgi:hypothetical protein